MTAPTGCHRIGARGWLYASRDGGDVPASLREAYEMSCHAFSVAVGAGRDGGVRRIVIPLSASSDDDTKRWVVHHQMTAMVSRCVVHVGRGAVGVHHDDGTG